MLMLVYLIWFEYHTCTAYAVGSPQTPYPYISTTKLKWKGARGRGKKEKKKRPKPSEMPRPFWIGKFFHLHGVTILQQKQVLAAPTKGKFQPSIDSD